MKQHIPAILTEIAGFYRPEDLLITAGAGWGETSICYCEYCKKSFKDKTGYNIPLNKIGTTRPTGDGTLEL